MALEKHVMDKMKLAMKSKDTVALASLRSIKNEIIKAKTAGSSSDGMTEDEELKLLQKLVKQRKESAEVFTSQNRAELAEAELAEAKIIEEFLPAQLSDEEIEKEVKAIIVETGADSMKDMGKVMGLASQRLSGRADGKTISKHVKSCLS